MLTGAAATARPGAHVPHFGSDRDASQRRIYPLCTPACLGRAARSRSRRQRPDARRRRAPKRPAQCRSRRRRRHRSDADWRHDVEVYGAAISRQSDERRRCAALRAGAARDRTTRPGSRRARARSFENPARQGRARRLWPGAGRGRRLRSGAGSARPRPLTRSARLAHPVRTRRRARPNGPPRRSAALLPDGAQDRSRRALRAVNLGLLTRCRRICATPRRRCAAPRRGSRSIRGCGKTSRSWSACKAASRKPKQSRAPICRPTRPPPMSPICGKCSRTSGEAQPVAHPGRRDAGDRHGRLAAAYAAHRSTAAPSRGSRPGRE